MEGIMEVWMVAESHIDGYYGQSFTNPLLFQNAERAMAWIREVRKRYQLSFALMMRDLPEATRTIKDWPRPEDLQDVSLIEFTFSGETTTNHVMMRLPVGE
jgi:hypothetical protein